MGAFKEPHGGELKELYLTESGAEQEKLAAGNYPNWNLTDRQLCDIELLLNGAFSPLDGFLSRVAYDSVLAKMRLPSGLVWPIPITLDVTRDFAASVKEGDRIALRDPEGVLIATMEISDIWEPDKALEARSVFGTDDLASPRGLLPAAPRGADVPRRQATRRRAADALRLQASRDSPRSYAAASASSAGARSLRSRRAIRCIARTRNSRCAPRARRRRTCCCIRSSA